MFEIAGVMFDKFRSHWIGQCKANPLSLLVLPPYRKLGNAIIIFVVFIEGQFIPDPETVQDSDGHPDGQPTNIDGSVTHIPHHVPPTDLKITLKHCVIVYVNVLCLSNCKGPQIIYYLVPVVKLPA